MSTSRRARRLPPGGWRGLTNATSSGELPRFVGLNNDWGAIRMVVENPGWQGTATKQSLPVHRDSRRQQPHDLSGYSIEPGGRHDGCFGWPDNADCGGVVVGFDQFDTERVAGLVDGATG